MAQLTINLSSLISNYERLKLRVGEDRSADSCHVAAVLKADAYGLGAGKVAQALQMAGCTMFFVATLPEAMELRFIVGDTPQIFMLNGFQNKHADLYIESNIIPVLNDIAEIESYKALAATYARVLPAILQIDTAMNRLGIDPQDIETFIHQKDAFSGIEIMCVMSHFASSEDAGTPLNEEQYKRFDAIVSSFPNIPKSLCNSSGIFRNEAYHYDIVRPGMALYGLNPTPETHNPMQQVVTLEAEILQVHHVQKGETAGYNATHRFENNARVAVVDIGYADGLFRSLSNQGHLYWNGVACPIRGRVSMDLTIVEIPKSVTTPPKAGDVLEVIGPHQTADALGQAAGTFGYEVLTSLSRRAERIYDHPNQSITRISTGNSVSRKAG